MNKKTLRGLTAIGIAIAFGVVIAAAVGSSRFTNRNVLTWFNSWGKGTANTDAPNADFEQVKTYAVTGDGEKLSDNGVYEMPKSMTIISNFTSAENPSFELTLGVKSDVAVNFVCFFEDPTSAWASGKGISDYASIKQTDKSKARLTIKAAFGEPVIIRATAGSEPTSCKIDWLQNVRTAGEITLGGSDATDEANIEATVIYGLGTVRGRAELASALLTLDGEFIDRVNQYLSFDIRFTGYGYDAVNATVELSDRYLVITDGELNYGMFIKDFDELAQGQKDAIYFAWNKAYLDMKSRNNVLIDVSVNYNYCGDTITRITESDIPGGAFTGDLRWSEIKTDKLEFGG